MFKFMTCFFSILFLFVVQLHAMEGAGLSSPEDFTPISSDYSCPGSRVSTPMIIDHSSLPTGETTPMTVDSSPVISGSASRSRSPEVSGKSAPTCSSYCSKKPGAVIPVYVDRSPSSSDDMFAFFDHIEERVSQAEQDNPRNPISLMLGKTLLPFYLRFPHMSSDEKMRWELAFQYNSMKLASRYDVRGLEVHCRSLSAPDDLRIVSAMLNPFISKKFNSLNITTLLKK